MSSTPGGAIRRSKVKWSDFIRRVDEPLTSMTPVFLFDENRGSNHDPLTFTYTPPRPSYEQLVAWIREHVDDPSLGTIECRDFIGRDYIAMQWKDRRHFWKAMEAFLVHGIAISPQCRLTGGWFRSSDLILPWLPATAEESLIRKMRRDRIESERYDLPGRTSSWVSICEGNFPLWQPNAWHTAAGREWVVELRRAAHKRDEPSSSDEELDVRRLEDVEDIAPVLLPVAAEDPSGSQPAVVVPAAVDEDVICVVCLEKPADTLVLPCQHQVCCKACSDKLKTTPNAHICVVCRQPITDVLADSV